MKYHERILEYIKIQQNTSEDSQSRKASKHNRKHRKRDRELVEGISEQLPAYDMQQLSH